MWQSLHGLLTSPTTPDAVKRQTLWIVGTAVQNNPSAQHAVRTIHSKKKLRFYLRVHCP